MKKPFTCILMLLSLASSLTAAHAADRFPWLQDLDHARSVAADEGKPLLIVFRCEP